MTSKLAHWCDGVLEAAWLIAIVATPLYFNIHSDRVFEPDKITLLRSLALLMSAVWLVRFLDQEGWRDFAWLRWRSDRSLWRRPFILPVAGLALVYVLSALVSVTPAVSWAGSYQRLQGTYTTLSYIVVFALMAATIRDRAQVGRAVTTVIVTSIAVALYAMLQHFALDPLPWGGDTRIRVAGSMGNSIFIGAYLIMAVPLTAARIFHAFAIILRDEELSYADVVRSSVYIFALAVQLIALYWTQSRGPMLGIAVGLYAFVLVLLVSLRNAAEDRGSLRLTEGVRAIALVIVGLVGAYGVWLLVLRGLVQGGVAAGLAGPMTTFLSFVGAVGLVVLGIFIIFALRRGWRWLWISWLTLAVLMAAWLSLFNVSGALAERYADTPLAGPALAEMAEWRNLPAVGRFGRLLDADRGSGRVRVLIWAGVLEMLRDTEPLDFPDGDQDRFRPLRWLLGYGPESMYVAYNRYYQPELATIENRNATPDRSHNETFDALIITGLGGFALWQALYLSVFYFGFTWLGVVRSRRDRNILLGLWVVMAALVGALFAAWRGAEFLGVAVPFGGIAGLVLYLIYYALVARPAGDASEHDPFQLDRLFMIGLVAAMLAHYVEIHFGIAIVATRLHFFVFLALLFLVGHRLPALQAAGPAGEAAGQDALTSGRGRRRRRRRVAARGPGGPAWLGPVLGQALVLAVMVGILGFNFMTYSPLPGQVFRTVEDVPAAGAIFRQSLFVNAGQDFIASPYLFLLIVFTWALGVLAVISEMVRGGLLKAPQHSPPLPVDRARLAAAPFLLMFALSLVSRFVDRGALSSPDPLVNMGQGLLLIWTGFCLLAAWLLLTGRPRGRWLAGLIALVGLIMALPVAIGGAGLVGLVLALGGAGALYFLWDHEWRELLAPAGIMGLVSLGLGFLFAYIHAGQIRASIIGPRTISPETPEIVRRVMEANQRAGFVSVLYLFVIGLLLLAGFFFAREAAGRARDFGRPVALIALVILGPLSLYLISLTNLQVVQADIVYKWARPWDQQASNLRNAGRLEESLATWDQAIGVYERAIELAPLEDFYYLFLGRAYLEKAGTTTSEVEATGLLTAAEARLLEAQTINPLNTDHTANLARLYTRWADASNDPALQADLLADARRHYEAALTLSPRNAVIWDEYARLELTLGQDCDRAFALYEHSLEVDPFYHVSYYQLADAYVDCAADLASDQARETYYQTAADYYEQGVAQTRRPAQPNDPRIWSQIAQLERQLGDLEAAVAAYERARLGADEQIPAWNIDYQIATVYAEMGEVNEALALAQQVLTTAPADVQGQVQSFIDSLGADAGGANSP